MKKNLLALLVITIGFSHQFFAQDIHWAHIHASPIYLNPAMTGLFEGDTRFIGNVRSQWNSFTTGYKTSMGSIDTKLLSFRGRDFLAGGVQFFSDKAGDLDFATKSTAVTVSYLKSFDDKGKNFISIGLQNSLFTNTVDYTKIIAFDRIAGIDGDTPNNIRYYSVSAGIGWFYAFNKNNMMYLGAAGYHLNNPMVSFVERENPVRENILYRKIVLHGGGTFRVSRMIDIKPSIIFMDQGPHQEITGGTFIRYTSRYKKRGKGKSKVYLGAWLRGSYEKDYKSLDAFIVSLGLDYKKTSLAFSYDFNISTLKRVSAGRGGPELSIIHIIGSEKTRRKSSSIKCPAF